MTTVHNPTNFKPEDYMVEDYLDNRPPEYNFFYGVPLEYWQSILDEWKAPFINYFGENYYNKIHHCAHCGNGRVRYITVCKYLPTGEYVVFGTICTQNLEFANRNEYKAAQVRARAELNHQRARIYAQYVAYLGANPELKDAIDCFENHKEVHGKNSFAADVINKLKQWGSISDRQRDSVMDSIKRDHVYFENKQKEEAEEKGPAPVGRQTVSGKILSMKDQETDFGWTTKMLVKLANNSKIWCTVPSKADVSVGDDIKFTATFTVSDKDPHFAFGKRPYLVN